MKNLFLGEKFINYVLEGAEMKHNMSSKLTVRYLFRAAMSGMILIFGYLLYFALAAKFETIGTEEVNLYEFGKFLGSAMFPLVLVAIYYTKSELLTSNMMMTSVAYYYGKLKAKNVLKILGLCFLGNFIGGLVFALLITSSTIITPGMEHVMASSIATKQAYIIDGMYWDLFVRAIFCNFMINLAMLMVYSGNIKDDIGRIAVIFFGVFAFMYLGLEHSVANTVLFTMGGFYDFFNGTELIQAGPAIMNVAIALLGNFIGGGIFIGIYYSFINDSRKFTEE